MTIVQFNKTYIEPGLELDMSSTINLMSILVLCSILFKTLLVTSTDSPYLNRLVPGNSRIFSASCSGINTPTLLEYIGDDLDKSKNKTLKSFEEEPFRQSPESLHYFDMKNIISLPPEPKNAQKKSSLKNENIFINGKCKRKSKKCLKSMSRNANEKSNPKISSWGGARFNSELSKRNKRFYLELSLLIKKAPMDMHKIFDRINLLKQATTFVWNTYPVIHKKFPKAPSTYISGDETPIKYTKLLYKFIIISLNKKPKANFNGVLATQRYDTILAFFRNHF